MTNIANTLEQSQQRSPQQNALIYEDRVFTYKSLYEQAGRLATALGQLGIQRGDRVALFLPNIPEFVLAYFAIQTLGAIAVSLNVMSKHDDIAYILQDSGAVALFTTAALGQEAQPIDVPTVRYLIVVEEAPSQPSPRARARREGGSPEGGVEEIGFTALLESASEITAPVVLAPHDPATIVYTSGTTGFPKGAVLSHSNLFFVAEAKKRYCGIRPDDRLILFLPLFHCFGQNAVMLSAIHTGATIVLHKRFVFTTVLESVQAHKVTMFFGVPTTYISLLQEANLVEELSSIRYYFSAASKLPEIIAQRWQEIYGTPIYEGYGLTETSPFASYNHESRYKLGSLGTPIEQVQMKVVDSDGREVARGERGEIIISGPNIMLGYWGNERATAATIRGGWLYSGDVGTQDEEGYFYIVDRIKDMINVSGYKIYPAEVERALYTHPAVGEVAVYGVPDHFKGEQVNAVVVLRDGYQATVEALLNHCRDTMASYKIPARLDIVSTIPKNPSGKVLKRVLRDQAIREATEPK